MLRTPRQRAGEEASLAQAQRGTAAEERTRDLARAFEALPGELQMVVGLRYQEQCSFAEIAAILELSEEHVQAAYALAMRELPQIGSAR